MRLRATFLLAALLLGCGGATPSSEEPESRPDPDALTEEAADAWAALDAERAARLGLRAVEAGGGTTAREIAARAALALGRHDAVMRALEGATSPHLLLLRARAQIAERDFAGAALTLEHVGAEEDPWVEAVLPAIRAASEVEPYAVSGGPAEVELEELPLPVIRVRVGAIETLALLGSSAQLVVLDPSVRATAGVIEELALGEARLGGVPHTVRSLEAVRTSLGAPIGAVLGLDVLAALRARIDGPNGRVRFGGAGGAEGTPAPMLTPTGSFLAVEGAVGDVPVWWTVDTAALFPLALVPGADEALGLADATWEPAGGGPEMTTVDALRIGSMQVEGIPVVRGLLDEAHGRAVGAPVAGSIGWMLLGQLVTRFDPEARRLVFE